MYKKITSCFVAVLMVLAFVPLQVARAAGDASIRVSVTETGSPVAGASIEIVGTDSFSTHRSASSSDEGTLFSGLKEGGYKIRVSLPSGYALESIAVDGGAPDTNPSNNSAEVDLGASEVLSVSFSCKKNPQSVFSSSDIVSNALAALDAYDTTLEVKADAKQKAGPFDILLVLDYSISMALSIKDGTNGLSRFDPESRYSAMETAVTEFLSSMKDSSVGTVGVVFYSDDAEAYDFSSDADNPASANSNYFTDLEDLDIDAFVEVLRDHPLGDSTRTDLAFAKARSVMSEATPLAAGETSQDKRRVVFFTDGEPGFGGYSSLFINDDREWPYTSPAYRLSGGKGDVGPFAGEGVQSAYPHNTFRVMAETYNQTKLLKHDNGDSLMVNEYVEANSPRVGLIENGQVVVSEPLDGDKPFKYYGASVASSTIGFSLLPVTTLTAQWTATGNVSDITGSAQLTQWYIDHETDVEEKWKDVNNWLNAASGPGITDSYLYADANGDYFPGYTSNAAKERNYAGTTISAENMASIKHGNYDREGVGLGATVSAIGIVDPSGLAKEYVDNYGYTQAIADMLAQDRADYIRGFLKQVASDDQAFSYTDEESLKEAFENIMHTIVGEYEDYYLSVDLESDWTVYEADGNPVGNTEADGIWIDGTTLWIGPLALSSAQTKELDFILYSKGDMASYSGEFSGSDPLLARTKMYAKDVNTGELKPVSDARVSKIKVSVRS